MVPILYKKLDKDNFQINEIFKLIDHFKYFHHAYDFRKKEFKNIQNDIFKLIYFFGYGNCKHVSFLVKYILDKSKIKNKIITIKSKVYTHITNLISYKNKNYLFDGFGNFYFECEVNRNVIIAKSFPKNKVLSLIKKQYYLASTMDKKHQNSKKWLKKNSHKFYEEALNNFEVYKSKISAKKYSFKFPLYKNSKIKENGIGIYDGEIFNSNSQIKFKNVENIVNFPKKHFEKYKYGLIINFKIKFKKKDNLIDIKANDFNLKKYVKGQYYDLSKDKKLQSEFLKKPNFLLKFKNYKNIDKLYITSYLSSFYI